MSFSIYLLKLPRAKKMSTDCPICLEEIIDPFQLKECGHKLCKTPCCKLLASKLDGMFTCPFCRTECDTCWTFDDIVDYLRVIEKCNFNQYTIQNRKQCVDRYRYQLLKLSKLYPILKKSYFTGSFAGSQGKQKKISIACLHMGIVSFILSLPSIFFSVDQKVLLQVFDNSRKSLQNFVEASPENYFKPKDIENKYCLKKDDVSEIIIIKI